MVLTLVSSARNAKPSLRTHYRPELKPTASLWRTLWIRSSCAALWKPYVFNTPFLIRAYETGGSINKQSCSMKEIDDLIAKAKFNQNDEQRRQQYRDVEALVVKNVCGMAPLWQRAAHRVVKPYIKGMIENKKPDDHYVPGDSKVELWSTTKK